MKRAVFFILIILLFAGAGEAPGEAPPVSVEGSARPGGVLFIRVNPGQEITGGSASFLKMTLPLQLKDGHARAILPIPLDTKPGKYDLKIIAESTSGDMIFHRTIPVRPHKFPVQYLRLPPSEEDKYEAPGVKQERADIDRALKTISKKYTWWGVFLWPVDAGISTGFGIKRYINGEDAGRHRGIDLAAAAGVPIRAANCGTVVLARNDFTLHGKTVIIDHGLGITSLYIHMSKIDVKEGDFVKKGEVIGKVGATGVTTGPHLHWGVYVGREAVDPGMFMGLPKGWK